MPATKEKAAVKAPATAGDFAVPAPRTSAYRVADGAPRVSCGKGSLARGLRIARKDTEKDVPVLLYLNGDSIAPVSNLAHVGRAISAGLITRPEIEYLWTLTK